MLAYRDKVHIDRTARFQQNQEEKVSRQRSQEAKSEAEEKRRTQFDADTEEERIRERNTRPAEDIVMRREQGNRQIYIDAVSQLRTRARLGRMMWQRTLRADGMVHIHQVFDSARNRPYVIKFIPVATENEVATVMDDVYLIKRISRNCDYLVDVDDCYYHAVGGLGGGYYIVVCIFECCEGGEASAAYSDAQRGKRPSISDQNLLSWIKQAALGLAALHENHFIHRNLTPRNIFLANTDDGQVAKVGDYPVTKTFEATLPEASTYAGGARYLAPELLKQDFYPGVISYPIDIWALGCSIYYLATGREICFGNAEDFATSLQDSLKAVPVRFSETIRGIISACLQIHADDRPTAYEIADMAHHELMIQEQEQEAQHRHRKGIIELFELIDEDQSGAIELDELLHAVSQNKVVIKLVKKSERLRPLLRPEKVRQIFDSIDTNGDGQLDLEEMLYFCTHLSRNPGQDRGLLNQMVALFNLVDRNHTLMITKETLLEAIESRPDVRSILSSHDLDP